MMQLICDGHALDLMAGASISFSKTNPLFAFDDLMCERTQAFELPDTPTNDRVFGLAKIPAYRGDGMRRRFDAQLIAGVVVKNGYLYVDSFDVKKRVYKAVFVCGELVALQAIRNAGKLKSLLNLGNVKTYGGAVLPPAAGGLNLWENVAYNQQGGAVHPSINLHKIIDEVREAVGARITYPQGIERVRIITAELKGLEACLVAFSRVFLSGYVDVTTTSTFPVVNNASVESENTDISQLFYTDDTQVTQYRYHYQEITQQWLTRVYAGRVRHIVARQPITITFPRDWPIDAYIGRFIAAGYFENSFEFYGDRDFAHDVSGNVVRYGEPLAGRSISINTGDRFVIVRESDYLWSNEPADLQWEQGWRVRDAFDIEGLTFQGGEIANGDAVRLQDNMPDCTLIELLKTMAALTGYALNYSDADGVTFDDLSVQTWPSVFVDAAVLGIENVARTFGNYGQNNVIRFESDESVQDAQRIRIAYTIDNENLEVENELQVVPFSEGKVGYYNGIPAIEVDEENETDTIANAPADALRMQRVSLALNTGLQALCDASTRIDILVRMTLAEFEAITPKTLIQYAGTRYVWSAADWQKNAAKFTLNAI